MRSNLVKSVAKGENNMKREFIKNLLPDISDEVLDKIMAEAGKDVESHKQTISTLTTERDGLKTQLDEANKSIQSYKDMDIDGIKAKASEWETKYKTDTKALEDKLAAQSYGYAVEKVAADIKFSSNGAKKAFLSDLTDKKLRLTEEGKLEGFNDFLEEYKKNDPAAFGTDDGKPFVAGGSGGSGGNGGASNSDLLRAAFGLPAESEK